MKRTVIDILAVGLLVIGFASLTGCEKSNDGAAEDAGKKVDEAAEEAGEKLDDLGG